MLTSAPHQPAGSLATRQSRRRFLGRCGVGVVALSAPALMAATQSKNLSVAEAFDREVEEFMAARKIPGGALAVVKERRLVYARGYGLADREAKTPVRADSLFRIASLSKPLTAIAVLKLVEAGKLPLEARPFEMVRLDGAAKPTAMADARLKEITVRQLLQHTAGWDREKSFDPMFRSRQIAHALGISSPPGPRDIIRYMLGETLDFAPGQQYAYSNFGYCLLGRVIEEVAGQPYEKHVQERLLAPIGIKRMRIGASRLEQRAEGEVRYYTRDKARASSVFGSPPERTPWPYGGFCLESMDAHGGWIASAVDLARVAAALDDPRRSPLLQRGTIRTMYAPPPAPAWRTRDQELKDAFYACGWMVRPVGLMGNANYWHSGSLPGAYSLLVRRWDGLSWVVLFNQRSEDTKFPDAAIDPALHRAAAAVTHWPEADLFKES